MTRSMVVELWSRTSGVVGIYRVSQLRSFADLCVGRWRIDSVSMVEGDMSNEATSTVSVMVEHSIQDMNGWLLRVL